MKRIYLIILATVAFVQLSTAQNSVPLPSGPVSFGTTSTSNLLNIGSSTTRGTVSITGSTTAAPVLSLTDSHTGGKQYSLYSGLSALGSFEIFDQTASAYRFVINSSGNVGIGTTNPLSGGATSSWLNVNGASNYTGGIVYSLASTPKGYTYVDLDNYMALQTVSGVGVKFVVNGNTGSSMILNTSGNVGIGTASPTARLTLASNNASNPNTGSEVDYAGEKIAFRNESAAGNFDIGTIKMVQPNGYYLDRGDMVFSTALGGVSGMSEKMRINSAGNVGIGTTDPSTYKLAVNGSIHAKQVNVDLTGWGDYVFNHDYNLRPLNEVKAYIDKNHHLPEMPSAATVEKDGINLGEMNKMLVKKVEELTLYLIDKDKQVNQLQTTAKTQQQQIDELKTQVSLLINLSNKK